MRLNIINQQWK